VKVRRIAEQWRYEGWSFPSFGDGIAAVRALAQGRVAPDVARLSDPEESRVGMAISAHGGTLERVARWYLDLRGQRQACLLIVGWGSDALLGGARQAEARVFIRRHGGLALGATPGRAWLRQRYHGPYLRDALVDASVLVETLETARRGATSSASTMSSPRRCGQPSETRAARSWVATCPMSTPRAPPCTSPSSPARVPTPRRDGAPPRGARPRRSSTTAAPSLTTTRSAPTTASRCRARSARSPSASCARSRSRWTRPAS